MSLFFSRAAAAGLLLLTTAATGAVAQSEAPGGWIVTLEASGFVGPRYPGSDELGFFGYPQVSFRRVGEPKRLVLPDDGFSLTLYDAPPFRVGLAGRFRGGRYDGADHRLIGLNDVQWSVEPGVFVEFWPTEFLRTRAELRHGVGGHHGFVADLGLDVVQRFGAATLAFGPRMALGDGDFTRTYFGVRPFEAALNANVHPYRPSGGITSVGLASSLTYDWSEQWSTTLSGSYQRLVGDAASSPIVQRFGSENQFTVGLGVSYSFTTAGW